MGIPLVGLLAVSVICGYGQVDFPEPGNLMPELAVPEKVFEVGEAIPYELKVTNAGNLDVKVTRTPVSAIPAGEYRVEVEDETGTVLHWPGRAWGGYAGYARRETVKSGQSTMFHGYVNQWARLDKPGNYTAIARWGYHSEFGREWTDSDQVAITVVEATDSGRDRRLKDALAELAKAMDPETRKKWPMSATTTDPRTVTDPRFLTPQDENRMAVLQVGFTLDPRAIPHLVTAARDSEFYQSADRALMMIGDDEKVRNALLDDLQKKGPYETLWYFLWNFQVDGEKSFPLLKRWLLEGNAEQRSHTLRALGTLDREHLDPCIKQSVMNALKDTDSNMRRHALQALGAAQYEGTLETVIDIAANDPDERVRGQAAIALGRYGNDMAIPVLKQLALDTEHRRSMRSAVIAMEKIGSAAARAALQECSKAGDPKLAEYCLSALARMNRAFETGSG